MFRETIEQREGLVRFRAENPQYKSVLANTYMLASDLEIESGELKAAMRPGRQGGRVRLRRRSGSPPSDRSSIAGWARPFMTAHSS